MGEGNGFQNLSAYVLELKAEEAFDLTQPFWLSEREMDKIQGSNCMQ